MVAKVFDTVTGPSIGSNVKLFQRFHKYWASIDQSTYKSGLDVEFIVSTHNPVKDDIIHFSIVELPVNIIINPNFLMFCLFTI